MILALFLANVLPKRLSDTIAAILGILMPINLVLALYYRSREPAVDYTDCLTEVVVPLLTVLHKETNEDAILNLKADFREATHSSHRSHANYKDRKYQYYDWTPVVLDVTLASQIHLQLDTRIWHRTRKSKNKKKTFIMLTLSYPKKHYSSVGYPETHYIARHKKKPKKYVLCMQKKTSRKTTGYHTQSEIDFNDIVAMIRKGYQTGTKHSQQKKP